MKTVIHIVGARPNFMKVAPIHRAIRESGRLKQLLVHTGQHYDAKMSDVFFSDLGMPQPEVHLGIGSGSHAEQTARVMMALEKVFAETKPALVSVVGDVNSTLAAALVAVKMGIPLSHVEAGLRSFDRTMPEEINRIVTDRIADFLLTPSRDGDENLRREGIEAEKIHCVGNVMIDSLLSNVERARKLDTLEKLGVKPGEFAVCTIHRASNVDDPAQLEELIGAIAFVASKVPVIFPVHPRTRQVIDGCPSSKAPGLKLVEPLGYLEFLALTSQAKLILTDSGGLQEESTALGVPCLTMRENTERPVTVEVGTNLVVGTRPERIREEAGKILAGFGKKGRCPELWDGKTGERIAQLYERVLGV